MGSLKLPIPTGNLHVINFDKMWNVIYMPDFGKIFNCTIKCKRSYRIMESSEVALKFKKIYIHLDNLNVGLKNY